MDRTIQPKVDQYWFIAFQNIFIEACVGHDLERHGASLT
jgi:hypothetical protein